MPLVKRSNEPYDAIQTTPAGHSQVLPKRMVQRLANFHPCIETICNCLQVRHLANAGTIMDLARFVVPGLTFLLNGKFYGLTLCRLPDLAWLGNQIYGNRVACIHCNLTNENIIASNDPLAFHIAGSNPDNALKLPLIGRVGLMQLLHFGYETLNQGVSRQVSDNVPSPSHMRSQTYAELHAVPEDEMPTRLRPNAPRRIYFSEIISYLRLTTCNIRQSASRSLGVSACTVMQLDRYAGWAEA